MNQWQQIEQGWRADVFRHFRQWDNIADSFNPLLIVLLLIVTLWLSRDTHARAWRFLGRSLLALGLTFLICKVVQKFHLLETHDIKGHFPSTHMAFSTSLATSLFYGNRRWFLLLPIIIAYAWLMTALRFHTWAHIGGGALLAFFVTWTAHFVLSRRQKVVIKPTTSTRTKSTSRKPRRASARTR